MNKPVKAQLGVLSRLIASQPKAPNPTGDSRVLTPENPETKPIIESIVRQTDAKIAAQDAILDQLETHDPTRFDVEEQLTGDDKLTRLVGDDFPFDDSQLEAMHGLVQEQYGCLTGPAGTGKTTVLKKLVDMLKDGLSVIRSEEHTSELQSLMRSSYAVFCLKKKKATTHKNNTRSNT